MKTKNKQKNKGPVSPNQGGFTLIELMVATSIFVVIMLASMGSLFTLLDASKNSRALRTAMDNVNFAMESMTRSIRMGTNYYCGTFNSTDLSSTLDCPDGGILISFVPQPQNSTPANSRIGYQVSGETLKRYDSNNTNGVPMVSPEVKIKTLKFFVNGSASNDNTQASVYIIMKGTVLVKGVATSFALQTMASQRNF